MWILYDFETSSRALIGQIISYAFWVMDERWEPVRTLTGKIRLKPTEFPELDAILITRTRIDLLQQDGKSEIDGAFEIHDFLSECIREYGHCILAGYNSSQFDLKFLRTTLIRNGINPYFMGRLSSIDILHYIQHIAMTHPNDFPWVSQGEYWTFSLESVSRSLGVLDTEQAHDAEADVEIMRNLIRCIEVRYGDALADFRPVRLPHNSRCEAEYVLFKQRIKATPPEKTIFRTWYRLFQSKSDLIVVDIYQFHKKKPSTLPELMGVLRYINCNTQYFSTEPISQAEALEWNSTITRVDELAAELKLNRDLYFELIRKPWDIEYQIHDMGFERINTLNKMIRQLTQSPERYQAIVTQNWRPNAPEKDRFLIQLFNRYALNNLPDLPVDLTDRYIVPRYINQTLVRDGDDSPTIGSQIERAQCLLIGNDDQSVLIAYLDYAHQFIERYNLNRFLKTSA